MQCSSRREVSGNGVYCVAINQGTWYGHEGRVVNIASAISDHLPVTVGGGDLHRRTAYFLKT